MKITFELNWQLALRWLLGVVLIWAAVGKLANVQDFSSALLAYRLPFPVAILKVVAIVLPWLELLCGLLLLANVRTQAALAWALLLFAIFTIATGQAWMRGLQIACGCLNLRLLGIRHGSELAVLLESVGFAFLRAIVLTAAALILFKQAEKSGEDPRGAM